MECFFLVVCSNSKFKFAVKGQMQCSTKKDARATRIRRGHFIAIFNFVCGSVLYPSVFFCGSVFYPSVFSQIVPNVEFLLTRVPCRWVEGVTGIRVGDFIAMADGKIRRAVQPPNAATSTNIFLVEVFA